MRSIRRTLTARLLVTIGALSLIVGVVLFAGIRSAVLAQFDAALRSRLASLEAATRWNGERVDLDYVSQAMPWYEPGPNAEYFELRDTSRGPQSESVVGRSPSLESLRWDHPPEEESLFVDARLPDGRPGRVATRIFRPPPDEDLDSPGKEGEKERAIATAPTVALTVAMSRDRLDGMLRIIGVALALASIVMIVGLVIGVRFALNAGLAPLRELSAEIEQISADSLSVRLSENDMPQELRPIHARLNELIGRLEAAFDRERRFSAAAAHELRTPIAELRSLLEVSACRPRDAKELQMTVADGLLLTVRMQQLLQSLLAFARSNPRAGELRLPVVPLMPILADVVQRHEPAALIRGGSIERAGLEDVDISADPAALDRILSNVLANAVEYASPAPLIRCAVRTDEDGHVCIDVTNPVQNVRQEDLDQFFEPFWSQRRSSAERSHLGLGLAVAKGFADGMGAALSAHLVDGRTVLLRMRVRAATVTA